MLTLISNRPTDPHKDVWPVDIKNVGRMFQTMEDHPEQVTLDYSGRIPSWLRGSLFRNGPGKYEFGDDVFAHFFDPSAIIQRVEIRDSEILNARGRFEIRDSEF